MSSRPAIDNRRCTRGFTYVEMLLSVTIMAMLMLALMGLVNTASETGDSVRSSNDLTQQARFAMARMVNNVSQTRLLLLPQRDKPDTNWPENIREQTLPPSAPSGDSTLATAVLAMTLPAYIDLDGNSVPDADNDGDGLIDEDLPEDIHNDAAAGIYLIDDGGNGTVDEGRAQDDDEQDDSEGEDPINGIDDDGDNNVDEDPSADMNEDGCSGVCGVDDDTDGAIDAGNVDDDDEQGGRDEDWYDPLVYYLDTGTLKERLPVPWDENGTDGITGRDFIITDIVDNVTRFRVERIDNTMPVDQVELLLELTDPSSGESISLRARVRPGGAL